MQEYKTKQREALVEYLIENRNVHLTAAEIAAHMRQSGNPLGTSTIYRQLDKLVASGAVRKYIVDESSPSCYQYVDDAKTCCEHFHLKCNRCGKLIHMDCDLLKQISQHMQHHHGFMIDNSKTLFYGLCSDCQCKDG